MKKLVPLALLGFLVWGIFRQGRKQTAETKTEQIPGGTGTITSDISGKGRPVPLNIPGIVPTVIPGIIG